VDLAGFHLPTAASAAATFTVVQGFFWHLEKTQNRNNRGCQGSLTWFCLVLGAALRLTDKLWFRSKGDEHTTHPGTGGRPHTLSGYGLRVFGAAMATVSGKSLASAYPASPSRGCGEHAACWISFICSGTPRAGSRLNASCGASASRQVTTPSCIILSVVPVWLWKSKRRYGWSASMTGRGVKARPTEPSWSTLSGEGSWTLRIPVDRDHRFRLIAIIESVRSRSCIPVDRDHWFR
jgi:hypothetical protein